MFKNNFKIEIKNFKCKLLIRIMYFNFFFLNYKNVLTAAAF